MFNVPDHSLYAMALVGLILITATLAYLVISQIQRDTDHQELKLRIQSWWWIIGAFFVVLASNTHFALAFIGFLSFLALKEFLSIVPRRQTDRRAIFWLYLSIPLQYYWVATQWYGMFIIFIPVYIFLFIPIRMVLIGDTKGFIKSAGILNWAVMLCVFSISHLGYLLVLPVKNSEAGAIGLVLYLLFTTQFNDVCQYVWGKLLGKHKIIPKVSPNKTWQGFIGGVFITATLSCFVAPALTPLSTLQGAGAGILIAVTGFFGDLVISSVKRDLQIKDTGVMIPGHGGILDRMDSLLYTSPLFFHYLYYLHY